MAVNCCGVPMRTFAGFGATVIVTPGGGGFPPGKPLEVPPHPMWSEVSASNPSRCIRFARCIVDKCARGDPWETLDEGTDYGQGQNPPGREYSF